MTTDSMFDRGGSGYTRGVNNTLGIPADRRSKMPDALVDGKVETDEPEVDCDKNDADEPVCQIAKANQELTEEKK